MKIKTFLYFFILKILFSGCSSIEQSTEDLPVIDLRKNYPEKEIVLSDIAKVTYVHLSTSNDEYLYDGTIKYLSANTIIVADESSGSVLFFTKDGIPKSRFNHYGAGPREYASGAGWSMKKYVGPILYDEKKDEVFIRPSFKNILQVYSLNGKYLRTIDYPSVNMEFFYTSEIDFFDSKSFIMHNADSFLLFSRANGKILEYVEMPNNEVNLIHSVYGVRPNGRQIKMVSRGLRMVRTTDGFNFCLPGDTVYYFDKNKKLTPVLYTTPSANDFDPKIIIDNFWDVGKYQFMRIHSIHYSNYIENYPDRTYPDKYYVRDKTTGEVFCQKIVIPDYKGKELFFSAYPLEVFQENMIHIELDLMELKDAYRANRLRGKLKELVSTLNENEDNNVFMIIEFN